MLCIDGTVVYEGTYDGRPVAVKRILQSHATLIAPEIKNLVASDHGPNIVRYHGNENDRNFIYLALERCDCNLYDLIRLYSTYSNQNESISIYLEKLKNVLRDVKLWEGNIDRPSPLLLKLMSDIVSGLFALHKLNIVHRDLKPQNILIIKESSTLCAKLSDMGISKHLSGFGTTGWKAPEQLLDGQHQTSSIDLFSLGCVLFFCITHGCHPFGDHDKRDGNIRKNNQPDLSLVKDFPEASDLISSLINFDPEKRPKVIEVLHHPLFWDAKNRLSFLCDTSDRVIKGADLDKALESTASTILGTERIVLINVLKWNKKVDEKIIRHFLPYAEGGYKFSSIRDLLRLIQNIVSQPLPEDIQKLVGTSYEGFDNYFTTRFPLLLIEVYKFVCTYCKGDECFKKYFMKSTEKSIADKS
ncbi:Serine/threonine-protein kinase/endoribonuclease ire-1 [Morus notabilis]|uniref:non-specific serine/threonine protein kinase n=1 Tax=Morus notabilis TaxID=981085 RepID=W9QQZ7_9ROSA|nr:Serine/threonine-protein kinase/endoribonuclease ire-1 [Morus notabilis]